MKKYVKGMKESSVTIEEQQAILEGCIKLYGALSSQEASKYYEKAHAALDKLLDAHRDKHFNMAMMLRYDADEEE